MPGFSAMAATDRQNLMAYLFGDEKSETVASPPPKNATPYVPYKFNGYTKFLDSQGYPAITPPWGTLTAIDLTHGKFAWRIPFGEFPELAARGLRDTGSENYGGPLVTRGGLLFIGASIHDRKFRAFDKRTGKLLWEYALPFSADATPVTYQVQGRQYVAIYASGGKERTGSGGGVYLAFALPEKRAKH